MMRLIAAMRFFLRELLTPYGFTLSFFHISLHGGLFAPGASLVMFVFADTTSVFLFRSFMLFFVYSDDFSAGLIRCLFCLRHALMMLAPALLSRFTPRAASRRARARDAPIARASRFRFRMISLSSTRGDGGRRAPWRRQDFAWASRLSTRRAIVRPPRDMSCRRGRRRPHRALLAQRRWRPRRPR